MGFFGSYDAPRLRHAELAVPVPDMRIERGGRRIIHRFSTEMAFAEHPRWPALLKPGVRPSRKVPILERKHRLSVVSEVSLRLDVSSCAREAPPQTDDFHGQVTEKKA